MNSTFSRLDAEDRKLPRKLLSVAYTCKKEHHLPLTLKLIVNLISYSHGFCYVIKWKMKWNSF